MIVDDQKAVVDFLAGWMGEPETIETHISRIFLSGDRALKMKRAVKLPYVDFSTPRLRLAACQKELELNSKTAPGLYLGVHRITREPDGGLAVDGGGELADAAIEMVRFDQSCLLDAMALQGALTPQLMTTVASMIASFHAEAPLAGAQSGAANMAGVLGINEAGFATSNVFAAGETDAFNTAFREALSRHTGLLDSRAMEGKVRRCHGDLHLRNICLLDGQPRLFDCIEFNDQIATIDVLYDLAFLLMDLWHRGFPHHANLVMNRYLDHTGDDGGFTLLPFFMAVRAAVRAHVSATQAEEATGDASKSVAEARSYFTLALELLAQQPPRLTAIGGLSGSGKTTVAEALAAHLGPPPGARIVESDRVRKALHGVSAQTRLPPQAYKPQVSQRVYAEMASRAAMLLGAGGAVLADAVFDRDEDRARIASVASDAGVPFSGFWLDTPADLLRQRVRARSSGPPDAGPSDAGVDVLEAQLARFSGDPGWRKIDAANEPGDIVRDILDALKLDPLPTR
jgi:aminoglycoside phosphotransferase family enzyme/predicted kinase